ncbi:reverse transcriptase domain protein [Colletotrichum truncatum]|uniref:Reverse transcriptase domain protein n=1 Tax=Colletotrichum truncatum TaxID=5467 RepID=A0ACC3YLI0_COLTU
MSSRASAKSPTPGSSSSSRNQPQSLAQEPANTEDFDMPDLKYDSDGDSSFTKESYDKLRLVHAATYLRGKALKWFELIQEEYLKCETLDECTTETRDIYANFKGFEDALRLLFQDPDEKRQAERDLKLFAEELETGLPEHSNYDHEIPLKEGKEPKLEAIYGLNQKEMEALDAYLKENLQKGYIRPSTSPAGYPILFVPKKNGKLRLCVDYRKLNDITIKNCYPLPLISELRDLLHGAQWFTALDLKGAYNLIRMKSSKEWKTAFRTRRGHYEYLVMPFGLTNAPATFQTMINHVLREFLDVFVVVYLDDILIFSKTLEDHKKHVHQVLRKLQDAKLLVEPEKSKFHAKEVEFLGFTIAPGILKMSKDKIAAVRDWPILQNVKDVQSFIGYVNYYRRFLEGYLDKNDPLTRLSKKDVPWQWEEEQEQAFNEIKQQVTSEPILVIPNPEKPFEVETDSSDYAIGGQLGQRDDEGRLHPCAFFSRKLHGPELNYQIHDKELMYEVKVYTDHKNLAHFTTSKDLNKRQIRWSEFLSEFNFRIIYRKGKENGRADALSRRPDHESREPITNVYYDSVLVIVDRLTKYLYFIPYMESSTAEDLAYKFLQVIVSQHGMPKEIVSDRDKLFTSKFWRSLISQLGSDYKMSTAFYPQTDSQTERINQIIETYLRCYFAYNSAVGESTKESPFYLNYGFNPTAYGQPRQGLTALKAVADINKLKEIQRDLPRDLEFVRERMRKYADKTRVEGLTLKEGDSAYLLRRNIKTKRPSDKLDFKKLRPFEITKKVSNVNFKLALPDTIKYHLVFHISLLELAPKGLRTIDHIEVDPEQDYEVERILDHIDQHDNTEIQYLIK